MIFLLAAVMIPLVFPVAAVKATYVATLQRSMSISTSQWRAVAVPQNSGPTNQPLVLLWTNSQGTAYQIFDIINPGTIDLTGFIFHVTVLRTSGGGNKPLDVTFEACVGASWTALNTCSGSIVTIGTTSTSLTTTVAQPVNVGGRLSIQASTTPSGSSQHSTTIDISVDTTHIRPITITSS